MIPHALTALNKHSQNNVLYDPNTAGNITKLQLKESDEILQFFGLPISTEMDKDEYQKLVEVWINKEDFFHELKYNFFKKTKSAQAMGCLCTIIVGWVIANVYKSAGLPHKVIS